MIAEVTDGAGANDVVVVNPGGVGYLMVMRRA